MQSATVTHQLKAANRWLNRQLWQQNSATAFFDPLVERINPLWVRGLARAEVIDLRPETHDTRTFTLRPNGRWTGFMPGQHLNLSVEIDGVRLTRTFSLSSSPQLFKDRGLIEITVKRMDQGTVTTWLHTALRVGGVVELSQAFGDFTLPDKPAPLFYLAGGSGITPILSHLKSLAAIGDNREIGLVYLVRDRTHLIAANRLRELATQLPGLRLRIIFTAERVGTDKLAAADIDAVVPYPARTHAYLCGPSGLTSRARDLLEQAGLDADRLHQAFFVAPAAASVDTTIGSLVRYSTGEVVTGDGRTTLLELAEKAGLKPAFGCRQGICRQCTCKKTGGLVMNRLTGRLSGPGEETIQPCISLPQGPVTVEL